MPLNDPIGSTALDVLQRNAQDTDRFVNQTSGTVTNRTGTTITPLPAIAQNAQSIIDSAASDLAAAVASTGWFVAGDFADGFEFTAYNQVGRDADGEFWSYNGSLPFTVTAGTVPSEPDYTQRGDAALRSALANPDSDALIAGFEARDVAQNSIRALLAASIRETDIAQIFALMRKDGLNLAALGDSITAGSGSGGHSIYGEVNPPINQAALNLFAFNLAASDPQFIAPQGNFVAAFTSASSSVPVGSLPFDSYQLRAGTADTVNILAPDRHSVAKEFVTLYILQRSTDAAARFTVENRSSANNDIFDSAVVDTWTEAPTYAGQLRPVQGRVRAIRVPITAGRNSYFRLTNCEVIDRGNGVPSSGSAVILGIARGRGVDFLNTAVSSTTLKEDSADNIMRGVSTSERFALAQSINANAFYIAFGTNDSKVGVSTPEAFRSELIALVTQVRNYKANAPIILATAPRGLDAPYLDNPIYNQVVREVAQSQKTSLFDIEYISDAIDIYADTVHPSRGGYDTIANALSSAIGLEYRKWYDYSPQEVPSLDGRTGVERFIPTTNLTGSNAEIFRKTINRPFFAQGLKLKVKAVIKNRIDTATPVLTVVLLQLIGYLEPDAGGTPSSTVTIDSVRNATPIAGGEAVGQSYLHAEYAFSERQESVDIVLSGRGVDMSVAQPAGGLQSYIEWEWV